jgi:hypothetical protein
MQRLPSALFRPIQTTDSKIAASLRPCCRSQLSKRLIKGMDPNFGLDVGVRRHEFGLLPLSASGMLLYLSKCHVKKKGSMMANVSN